MIGDRRKAASALPAQVLWDGKGKFEGPLDRWAREAEKELEREEEETPLSKGALMILRAFEERRRSGKDEGWISIRELTVITGLQAVSTRISELHKKDIRTEWNHRSGPESRHRLVDLEDVRRYENKKACETRPRGVSNRFVDGTHTEVR